LLSEQQERKMSLSSTITINDRVRGEYDQTEFPRTPVQPDQCFGTGRCSHETVPFFDLRRLFRETLFRLLKYRPSGTAVSKSWLPCALQSALASNQDSQTRRMEAPGRPTETPCHCPRHCRLVGTDNSALLS
jgi:hypothetical protein